MTHMHLDRTTNAFYLEDLKKIPILRRIMEPDAMKLIDGIIKCEEKNGKHCSCGTLTSVDPCECGQHTDVSEPKLDIMKYIGAYGKRTKIGKSKNEFANKLYSVDVNFIEGEYQGISLDMSGLFSAVALNMTDRVGKAETPEIVVQRMLVTRVEQSGIADELYESYVYHLSHADVLYGFQIKLHSSDIVEKIMYANPRVNPSMNPLGIARDCGSATSRDGYRLFDSVKGDGEVLFMESVDVYVTYNRTNLDKYRKNSGLVGAPPMILKKGTFYYPILMDVARALGFA
jgi:hypothetical protein